MASALARRRKLASFGAQHRRAAPHGHVIVCDAVRPRQASAHVALWQRVHGQRVRGSRYQPRCDGRGDWSQLHDQARKLCLGITARTARPHRAQAVRDLLLHHQ